MRAITRNDWQKWQQYQRFKKDDPNGSLWARMRHLTNLVDSMPDLPKEIIDAVNCLDAEIGYYTNRAPLSVLDQYVSIEELKQCITTTPK